MSAADWREAQCADDTSDGYGDDWHDTPTTAVPEPTPLTPWQLERLAEDLTGLYRALAATGALQPFVDQIHDRRSRMHAQYRARRRRRW